MAEENHVLSVIGRRPPVETDRHIPNVHYWTVDLLDSERFSTVLTDIIRQNGKLNYLVFLQRYRGEGDSWRGEIEVSLTASKNTIERLADEFDGSDENSIVLVSSLAGHFVAEEQPLSYHLAKAGINQMVRYYAFVLGPKGIRVNCVSSGAVLKEESKDYYLQNKQIYNLYKRIIPLGRMVTSEDIAHVIAFLCSPKASLMTGQNLVVDGGVSLQGQESLARKLTGRPHPNSLSQPRRKAR